MKLLRKVCSLSACMFAIVAVLDGIAIPASADPSIRQQQWYLDALGIPQAQKISTGRGITVAVIDETGVDAANPDLAGQVLEGAGFGGSSNGKSTEDHASHATLTAGVIAAKGGDNSHALGIAPGAKILPVALSDDPSPESISRAIRWAADHGAQVINISLGAAYDEPPKVEVDAVNYALSKDAVVVAAAGNTTAGMTTVAAPASVPGTIAVSGVTNHADFWSGSVSGKEVVLAAPASHIVNTWIHARSWYGYGDGTSQAAPIVAGTAALIRSKYPDMNAANVINRLIKTAKDQGKPGRDQYFGYGTVRPVDALTKDVPEVSTNPLVKNAGGSATARPNSGAHPYHVKGAPKIGGITVRAWVALGVIVLVFIAGLIVVIVAVGRRSRRRKASPQFGPPGQQPAWTQQPYSGGPPQSQGPWPGPYGGQGPPPGPGPSFGAPPPPPGSAPGGGEPTGSAEAPTGSQRHPG